MNITELISRARRESGDTETPYLWSDAQLLDLFNDAEEEACKRKQLIFDATTAAACNIAVASGDRVKDLHESIVYITAAYLVDSSGAYIYLSLKDRDELDRIYPTWREAAGEPVYLVVDEDSCQLVPEPEADYTLYLEVYRTPIDSEKMVLPGGEEDPVSPTIARAHHKHLTNYVLAEIFKDPDADTYSPGKADLHEKRFNDYFGLPTDADRGRKARENRPHHNKLW
jgi:hypothetical protein